MFKSVEDEILLCLYLVKSMSKRSQSVYPRLLIKFWLSPSRHLLAQSQQWKHQNHCSCISIVDFEEVIARLAVKKTREFNQNFIFFYNLCSAL